ncbi:TonB-dependent receptor [Parahaliea mediterranea]|nr:TonB-dependent receptor [Parahaliea mediterranea]
MDINHKPVALRRSVAAIRTILAANVALAAGVTAPSAMAQIEEVVVTAQQREQNLQDVPISISAFTSDAVDKNMFRDVTDYVMKTPNASFTSAGARSRRDISIRGVTNFVGQNNAIRTSTFGFYVDGFSVSSASINPPMMDIERIEVLRGPQATYFGRNALGGGISVTSKKPTNEFEGSIMADYSRFDTVDLEGVLNIPIIENVLAARVNLKHAESDGNIENINPRGGGNDSKYKYAKASVLYTPNDALTVNVFGSYADENVGMREGVPSGVFSTFAGGTLFADFPDLDGDGLADPDPDGVGFYPDNQSKVNFNAPQDVGTEFKYLVGRLDYAFDTMTFTSITGWMESDFFLMGDIDGGSVDYLREYRTVPRESISQEFRLQSDDSSDLSWNVGLLYAKDEGTMDNKTYVGDAGLPNFGLPGGFLIDSEDSEHESENWAAFGQLDYMVTDRLTLSAGGRYSEETKTSTILGFSGALVTEVSYEDTFRDFSPKVAANYVMSDEISLYATISKGFKSGGVQDAPFESAQSFDPEVLWNYEVGMKAELLDRRLRLNTALFYMDWEDMQASFQQAGTDDEGNFILFGGIDNAEKATSQGAEISGTAMLGEDFVVNFGVGYLDAKFDTFTAYIDGQNRVLDDRTIPNAPKWTASADAEYGFQVGADLRGFVRAEWNYRDEVRPSTTALINSGFPWEVPSYDVVNLRAGVENDTYSVVAYIENALDEEYYTNAYQKAFMSGLFIEPSYQTYGVRVKYNFN